MLSDSAGVVRHTVISESNLCNKEIRVALESCISIIPSADMEKSLRLWVGGLGFRVDSEIREGAFSWRKGSASHLKGVTP
jgi:hypothetical protein